MPYNHRGLEAFQVGKTCSECGTKDFMGTSYECSECRNFMWCESCCDKDQESPHPHPHALKRTLCPLDASALDLHTRYCNGCHTGEYPGKRHACRRCKELDYCEICWQSRIFDPRKGANPHTKNCSFVYYEPEKKKGYANCFARSLKIQNYYGTQLGTREYDHLDCNSTSERIKLARKIGFALYNKPSMVPGESDSGYTSKFGYNKEQEETIEKLRNMCIALDEKYHSDSIVWINFIFVCYFEENKFENAKVDTTMTGCGVLSMGVGLAGPFIPLVPVAGAILTTSAVLSGIWGLGRSLHKLYDRASHEQSIQPFHDKESFFTWLSIVSSTSSFGALGATRYTTNMASKGVVISSRAKSLATSAIFGNLCVQGFGTVAGVTNIVDKLWSSEEITPLELFQVSASLLFFRNQYSNMKNADTIIKDLQHCTFARVRENLSPEQAKTLERLVAEDLYRAQYEGRLGGENVMRDIHKMQASGRPLKFQAPATDGTSITANRHATAAGIDQLYQMNGKLLPISTDHESVIKTADTAARTRYNGAILKKAGKQQQTTVFNISPQDLDAAVARNMKQGNVQRGGRNNLETVVTLEGNYPATNVQTKSVTGNAGVTLEHAIKETVVIRNPSVVVDPQGKATHLCSNPDSNLANFDPNAPGVHKLELIRSDAAGNKEYVYLNCAGRVTGKSRGDERRRDFDWYFENIA